MFVICYLLAALTTTAVALIGSSVAGYSAWESLGMALLAVVFLQMVILSYVILATIRNTRGSRATRPKTARNQLSIQPK